MASPSHEPFIEDEETLRKYLLDADLPSLLPALAQLTGDLALVDPSFAPRELMNVSGIQPQGGMSPEVQAIARDLALRAILRYRDGGFVAADTPAAPQLRKLIEFITGPLPHGYMDFVSVELGLESDPEAPGWRKDDIAPDRPFYAVVIGAGQSGLVAGYRLSQAGIDYLIVEKNPDLGGTWYENRYPGCRLDTSNFAYSYSFAQKTDWRQDYSKREEIYQYFKDAARELGVDQRIRYNTEIESMVFDEETDLWNLTMRAGDGSREQMTANIVIAAVGQLNRPKLPDIPGRDSFAGHSWHTARWNDEVDLTGLRVAVIGTGASAYQVIPSIVDEVGRLVVFQRTPPWMQPAPTYHDDIAAGQQWLLRHIPHYGNWYRFLQFWISVEGRVPYLRVDPSWTNPVSVSAKNEELRQLLEAHIANQYTDRPDLLEKVIPHYPPGAKRTTRDNGVWAAALKHEHTDVVAEPIAEITPTGIRTVDGRAYDLDVIIYATGFNASDFLSPMTVIGRDGLNLHEWWAGDARAYLGIQIPRFPNLFSILGPTSMLVVSGSVIMFSEMASHYILECVRLLLEDHRSSIEVRQDFHDEWNEQVDAENRLMAWGASNVNSWYKNAHGRVTQIWPFPIIDYWNATRRPDPEHQVLH